VRRGNVLAVKENQKGLYEDIKASFERMEGGQTAGITE
jgi:hypothetical protein